ncbi:MAG: hypothetical protein ACN6PI_03540 [Sphingobacterium siyangense]
MKRILLLFTIFIFIGGCKDQYEINPKDPIKEKIDLLRADFQKQTNYNQTDSNFLIANLKTSINWENNKIVSDDTIYVKVNLFDQVQLLSTDSSKVAVENLVWIKAIKTKDKWNYILITFIPENTKQGYTGTIISKSILTGRQSTIYYKEGHKIQREVINIKIANGKKSTTERKCVYGYVNGILNYVNCEPQRTGTDDPDQGGGPIDYETLDPFGDDGSGAGGSGTSGEGDAEAAVNDFNERIDDSNLPDCMKNVLERLQMLKGNTVADIIRKFSGELPGYNLRLGMKENNNPMQVAGTNSEITNGFALIEFNSNLLTTQNVTDLAFATTVLHESIHAYLFALYKSDPSAASLTYPELFEKYSKKKALDNNLQHETIARDFVADLARSIKNYGELKGYTIDKQVYDDLAWKGLTETSSFKMLSENDKSRIIDRIMAEQYDSRKDNGIKQKGSRLGC